MFARDFNRIRRTLYLDALVFGAGNKKGHPFGQPLLGINIF